MPFVGRTAELARLTALVDRAQTDGRQIALVGGEPGSGKTRLARELAEHVRSGGVRVLYGACDPAVRTPYEPYVEALEPALAAGEREPEAGGHPAALIRLLPGLRAGAGGPAPASRRRGAQGPGCRASRAARRADLAAGAARPRRAGAARPR